MKRARTVLAVTLVVVAGLVAMQPVSAGSVEPQSGQGFFNTGFPVQGEGLFTRAMAPEGIAYIAGSDVAFDFTLTSSFLEVERLSWRGTHVTNPAAPGDTVYSHYERQAPEVSDYRSAVVVAQDVRPSLTLIAAPKGPDAGPRVTLDGVPQSRVTLTGEGARSLAAVGEDPDVSGGETRYTPQHDVPRAHVAARGTPDVVRVEGNFTLKVWDVDLRVTDAGGAVDAVLTGRHERRDAAAVSESEIAYALLHVTGGVLEVRGAHAAELLAPRVLLDVDGGGKLPAAVGGYRAGDVKYEAIGEDVTFTGAVRLDARLLDGRTDRALVDFSGTLESISLAPVAASDAGAGFLASPAGRVAATGTGVIALLVGAAVLAGGERRAAAGRFLRAPVNPLRQATRSRAERVEDAVAALAEGEDARAVKILEALLRETPSDVVLLVDYGCALERIGRTRAARDAFETAVTEDPGNAEAHYYYARVLARLNLSASALPHLQRAITLDARLAEMARRDDGFRSLADHPAFVGLTG